MSDYAAAAGRPDGRERDDGAGERSACNARHDGRPARRTPAHGPRPRLQ